MMKKADPTFEQNGKKPSVRTTDRSVSKLVTLGMLAAVSVVLVYAVRFPIFPTASFLEYDPADIPIFIATFLYGPLSGFLLTVVVSVVQGLTVSAQSGFIGIMMHIFATGSFVLVAGNIYKRKPDVVGTIISLCAGVATMVAAMVVWNVIFTPIFMGVPRQAVIGMLVPIIIPFNLIKAGVNAAIAFVVFKSVSLILKARK